MKSSITHNSIFSYPFSHNSYVNKWESTLHFTCSDISPLSSSGPHVQQRALSARQRPTRGGAPYKLLVLSTVILHTPRRLVPSRPFGSRHLPGCSVLPWPAVDTLLATRVSSWLPVSWTLGALAVTFHPQDFSAPSLLSSIQYDVVRLRFNTFCG